MVGRQVILTNRAFTHEELLQFMSERWDTEEYNHFVTDPAVSQYTKHYVVLPATTRYMIIVYSRAAGGLFSRDNKVDFVVSFTADPNATTDDRIKKYF